MEPIAGLPELGPVDRNEWEEVPRRRRSGMPLAAMVGSSPVEGAAYGVRTTSPRSDSPHACGHAGRSKGIVT